MRVRYMCLIVSHDMKLCAIAHTHGFACNMHTLHAYTWSKYCYMLMHINVCMTCNLQILLQGLPTNQMPEDEEIFTYTYILINQV